MEYQVILYTHIGVVALFVLHLFVRLFYLWTGKDENLLLYSERSKTINVGIIIVLILTGIYLGFTYDFSEGRWFVVKLLLIGVAAFLGDYAFKNFSKLAGLGVLLVLAYIIAISYTKSLDLMPGDKAPNSILIR